MNATDISNISDQYPEQLFSKNTPDIENVYKDLMRQWHPDISTSTDASKVSAKINTLYKYAQEKIKNGTYGFKEYRTTSGVAYYNEQKLKYQLKEAALANTAIQNIRYLHSKDLTKISLHSSLIPSYNNNYEFNKQVQEIPLAELLSRETIDVRHIAWIINRCYSFGCLCEQLKVNYNAFSPEYLFIDCAKHNILFYLGFEFSTAANKPIKILPSCIAKYYNKNDVNFQITCIKKLGLKLLKDEHGMKLIGCKDQATAKLLQYFKSPNTRTRILDEFAYFKNTVLPSCFGNPLFVNFPINVSDYYL